MRHGSLFTGIGGFDLAAEWMGWENVFQVEKDKFCNKVLEKNFPNVKRYGDIKEFDGTKYRGAIDILTGGFPCQPFSHAGNKKGTADDRYLWPEHFRIIQESKPIFVVGENVTGIIDMEIDNIIADLESEGYTTEQFIIPAISVNAPHRRDRVWIIAYSDNNTIRLLGKKIREEAEIQRINRKELYPRVSERTDNVPSYSNSTRLQGSKNKGSSKRKGQRKYQQFAGSICPTWENFPTQSPLCGRDDGVPDRVDRLKGLGNAIVPQVAYELFKTIEQFAYLESKE